MKNYTLRAVIDASALVNRIRAAIEAGEPAMVVPDGVTVSFTRVPVEPARPTVTSALRLACQGGPLPTLTIDLVRRNASRIKPGHVKALAAKVLRDEGCSYRAIGRALGVSSTQAYRLVNGGRQ